MCVAGIALHLAVRKNDPEPDTTSYLIFLGSLLGLAMLLGAAKYLNETKNFDGTVHLIFQPAEEGAHGAHTMIKEGLFKKFPCDAVFGLHNWPELPKGKIAFRTGPLMAAADRFAIQIRGKGGHAAAPHQTIDPIVVGSHIITALQTLVSRNANPVDTAETEMAAAD